MLGERIEEHGANVWLVNTGWTGGAYGSGHRMKIAYTRAMVAAALDGSLDDVETVADPIFGVHIPVSVPGVPDEVLQPRNTWSDVREFDKQAKKLAQMFIDNFKEFEGEVSDEVVAAGPTV